MNTQNDNKTNLQDSGQDTLNQYTSSAKQETSSQEENPVIPSPDISELAKEIPSQEKDDSDKPSHEQENQESLKEFNSTPIDTPSQIPLGDSLSPSESLPEESEEPGQLDDIKTQLNLNQEPEEENNPKSEDNEEKPFSQKNEEDPVVSPEPETVPEPETTPEPEIKTETTTSIDPPQNPQDIKQKIDEVLSYNSSDSVVGSNSDKPKTSLLKILFIFSLVVFILIAALLIYFLFINPEIKENNINDGNQVVPTTNQENNQTKETCELNGFIYNLNESFPSADGCNTCTCQSANSITCTKKDCASDPSISGATESAVVSPATPSSPAVEDNLVPTTTELKE